MKTKTQPQWFQIKAISPKNLEVRLFGEIGWEVYADEFIAELDKHPKSADIDLRINSGGGSVFEGLHIYNRLTMHEGEINAVVEGLAASMATVIACAATTVSMMPMSMYMIHNPATMAWGDQDDLKKAADTLDKIKDILIDAYVSKTALDRDVISELMDNETWYTGAEAVDAGFADSLTEDETLDIAACLKMHDLSWFNKVPASVTPANNSNPAASLPMFVLVDNPTPTPKPTPATSATTGASTMTPEEKAALEAEKAQDKAAITAQVKADETTRRADVRNVFATFTGTGIPALLNACLDDTECSVQDANAKLVEHLKKQEATPTGAATTTHDQVEKKREAAINWISARAQLVEKDGQRIVAAGDNPYRGTRLLDMCRMALESAGINPAGMLPMEIANAAITHSTSDFPNIMEEAMHKVMLNGYHTAADTWSSFCKVGDLSDFRPHHRHIMGSFSDLLPTNENGEIQDGTLDDTTKEQIVGQMKGRILNLSHEAIVNDDMSVFNDTAQQLGRAGRRSVENDVYALLALNSGMGPTMADGNTLFHADHGNVTTGAPSVEAFDAAITLLGKQKLPNKDSKADEYIDLASPPTFVGPLGMRGDVRVINEAQYDPDTSNKLQKPNKSRGILGQLVHSPRLTGLPWMLFANPAELPVLEVGFVQGQSEPQLVMENSFRQNGVAWRVVMSYGVAAVNRLGSMRSTGN